MSCCYLMITYVISFLFKLLPGFWLLTAWLDIPHRLSLLMSTKHGSDASHLLPFFTLFVPRPPGWFCSQACVTFSLPNQLHPVPCLQALSLSGLFPLGFRKPSTEIPATGILTSPTPSPILISFLTSSLSFYPKNGFHISFFHLYSHFMNQPWTLWSHTDAAPGDVIGILLRSLGM